MTETALKQPYGWAEAYGAKCDIQAPPESGEDRLRPDWTLDRMNGRERWRRKRKAATSSWCCLNEPLCKRGTTSDVLITYSLNGLGINE